MVRRSGFMGLASAVILISILSLAWAAPAEPPVKEGPEVSPAAAALLHLLNTASEDTLKGTVGLPEGVVSKLMARRANGGKFSDLVEVRYYTEISSADLERILRPFQEIEDAKALEASRKPVPEPADQGKATGRLKRGQAAPEQDKGSPGAAPTPGAAGPISAIRPGFYGKLPGYDQLDTIDPLKRSEFLETVNREMCTCGCQNETIAFCLVNDPSCPVVKTRAKKIYDDIMSRPPR